MGVCGGVEPSLELMQADLQSLGPALKGSIAGLYTHLPCCQVWAGHEIASRQGSPEAVAQHFPFSQRWGGGLCSGLEVMSQPAP